MNLKAKWAGLPKWAKWAIIAGAVLMVTGGGYVAMTSVKVLRQGDSRWGDELLGLGTLTIKRAGCLLTSLTMATNSLNNQSLTPSNVNKILQERAAAWAGASSGMNRSNMILDVAVPALGMKIVQRLRKGSTPPPTVANIKAVADKALQSGTLAIVHVSKDGDDTGDHFVIVNGHNEKGYVISDPAFGTTIQLDDNFTGKTKKGTVYRPVGIISLVSAAPAKVA